MAGPNAFADNLDVYPPARPEVLETSEGDNLAFEEYVSLLKGRYSLNGKLLLIQIPQFDFRYFNTAAAKSNGYYAYPPTGLQYLTSAVEGRDLEVRILDLNYELLARLNSDESFAPRDWLILLDEYLETYKPSIIGVSCMFDTGIQPLLEILRRLREKNKFVVVTGGVVPTYDWEKLLRDGLCHFVCEGESENKLNYLLDRLLKNETQTSPAPGIRFRDGGGGFKRTQGLPDVVHPKGNLISTYRLVPIESYCRVGSLNPFSRMAGINKPYAAIVLNRGCRAACTFCAVRDFNGKGVRPRSVEETLEEIVYLHRERGIQHFEFLDDDLLRYRDAVVQLLQGISDEKLRITWSANNGLIANSLDSELLELFRTTGCTGFRIGIESGNVEILKTIKKPATLESLRRASALLENHPDLFVCGNIIVGFKEETFGQMLDSFRFSIEMKLDWTAFTICQVIRGASAFENFTEYFNERMNANGKTVANFIPSRDSKGGQIPTLENILTGLDIFRIPRDEKPGKEQIKQIWFAFNLIGNFIDNKNLKPGGRPEKFIAWVSMAQVSYPQNPYMGLFLALAHLMAGNDSLSRQQYDKALMNLNGSDYWKDRFDRFGLGETIDRFPRNAEAAGTVLAALRARVFSEIDNG